MNILNRKQNTTIISLFVDKHYLPFLLEECSKRYSEVELESLNYFLSEYSVIYVYQISEVSLFNSANRHCQVSGMRMYEVVELQCLVEMP